mmetsp:Transcript_12869/g.33403  ORF Transcript_12869/g.33403 Transcript_12869/m.33403 type:complete len:111 (-) Transcript_12869:253-585(-)
MLSAGWGVQVGGDTGDTDAVRHRLRRAVKAGHAEAVDAVVGVLHCTASGCRYWLHGTSAVPKPTRSAWAKSTPRSAAGARASSRACCHVPPCRSRKMRSWGPRSSAGGQG